MKRFRRFWIWLAGTSVAILLLMVAAFMGGCCFPPPSYEAAIGLLDIASGDEDSPLKRRTPTPVIEEVSYTVEGRARRADLYLSGENQRGALVLIPGAAEQGKDDPRLQGFARTLARLQFAVLVPDMENVRKLRVGPDDIEDIADAAVYLAGRPDLGATGGVGLVAVSYAVGPAVLAALTPRARDHVRFIYAIGGYHSMRKMVTFVTTGYYGGEFGSMEGWEYLEPFPYGRWAFLRSNAHRVESETDQRLLDQIAQARLYDPEADISAWRRELGPEGTAILDLLENDDPLQVPALLEDLPEQVTTDLKALDISQHDLSQLQARMILVHGMKDPIIPYTESLELARRAGDGNNPLYLPRALSHVDLEKPGLGDTLRLWCAVDALLREREQPRPNRPARSRINPRTH